ncbi:MAG: hypothetical protein NVS9B4_00670 [Candidatus Acidiferrum sp.]
MPLKHTTIYALHDPVTLELRYIGKTSGTLEKRLAAHLRDAQNTSTLRCSTYRLTWLRSLSAPPVIVPLLITSHEFSVDMERAVIQHFRKLGYRLTNKTGGGEGKPGWVPPAEYREAMSSKLTGIKRSAETIDKCKIAAQKRGIPAAARVAVTAHNTGRALSEEHKQALSVANKGKQNSLGHKQSPEWIAALKSRMKGNQYSLGVHPSAKTLAKLSIANAGRTHMRGRKLTAETKAKISQSLMGNKRSLGFKQSAESNAKRSAALKGIPKHGTS